MDKKDYLEYISPCGLHCGKCFAFKDRDIRKLSIELKENLGNFETYAKRFETIIDPVFENYKSFKEMLDYFTTVECGGCRKEECKFFKNCNVRSCTENKDVEFCYECSEFPCDHTGFDENLYKRYVSINKRIKEIGPHKYYQEIKYVPRY